MDTLTNLRSDFRNFLFAVWTQALGLPEPSPLQYDIAHELQHGWNPGQDGITRKQLQAARGFGKTYILCAWAVWRLWLNPDHKILFISMNTNRAVEAIRLMRQIISGLDFLAGMVPKPHQRDGANRFDVGSVTRPAKDPSVAAYGVTSAVAGTHPDEIIADDTETKENSLTVALRERLMAAYHEFESMIQPGGAITHMGTPQSKDSCYNELADHYDLRRWPCRYPDPMDASACKRIAPWLLQQVLSGQAQAGTPSYPERFGEEQLQEKLAVYGPYHFALQMMLDTGLADSNRYPLKAHNLIVCPTDIERAPTNVVWGQGSKLNIRVKGHGEDGLYAPAWMEDTWEEYQKGLMFVDPSGSGSDQTGYAVVKSLHGILYVLDAGGLDGGHSDGTLQKLARICLACKVRHVVVEANYGDGLFEKALIPVLARIVGPCRVESRKVSRQKEMRICDTLEPVVCAHRLVVDQGAARNEDFIYQLTHITRDRGSLARDDIIDALAGAVHEFADHLGLVPEREEAKRKKREMEKMVKEWGKSKGSRGRIVDTTNLPTRWQRKKSRMENLSGRRRLNAAR